MSRNPIYAVLGFGLGLLVAEVLKPKEETPRVEPQRKGLWALALKSQWDVTDRGFKLIQWTGVAATLQVSAFKTHDWELIFVSFLPIVALLCVGLRLMFWLVDHPLIDFRKKSYRILMALLLVVIFGGSLRLFFEIWSRVIYSLFLTVPDIFVVAAPISGF